MLERRPIKDCSTVILNVCNKFFQIRRKSDPTFCVPSYAVWVKEVLSTKIKTKRSVAMEGEALPYPETCQIIARPQRLLKRPYYLTLGQVRLTRSAL